jgi:hypothetical protein
MTMTVVRIIFLVIVVGLLAIAILAGRRRTPTTPIPAPAGAHAPPPAAGHGHAPRARWKKYIPRVLGPLLLIAIVALGIWGGSELFGYIKKKMVGIAHASNREDVIIRTQLVENPEPRVVTGVTPVSITADYEFNIEADTVGTIIRITYPDGQYMDYVVGKECQQFPTPSYSGPKVFTDPRDPKGSHIAFRLYRLQPGEGTCK